MLEKEKYINKLNIDDIIKRKKHLEVDDNGNYTLNNRKVKKKRKTKLF